MTKETGTPPDWAKIDSWVWEAYTGNAVYGWKEGEWPEYAVTFEPDERLPVPRLHESPEACSRMIGIANRDNMLVAITRQPDGGFIARLTEPGPCQVVTEAIGPTREQAFVVALYRATGEEDI